MGGEYVISAVEIENSLQHGLRFERQFSSAGSYWHINLYYVLPTAAADVANADSTIGTGMRRTTNTPSEFPVTNRTRRRIINAGDGRHNAIVVSERLPGN